MMADVPASKWSVAELNTLIASKKFQQDQAALDSSREKIRTAEMRWKEVEHLCRASNVNRDWKQCKKRWEKLFTDFKKVFDYQKQTPSGRDGYFQLSRTEKKDRSLPPKFMEELFQSMVVFVPRNRAVDPHPDQFVDSGVEALLQTPIHTTSEGEGVNSMNTGTALPSETLDSTLPSDSATASSPTRAQTEPTAGARRQNSDSINDGDTGLAEKTTRGWKRTKSERTASELQKITQTFVAAISEDRISRREEHQEQICLEERKHIECLSQQKEAMEAAKETGKGVADALAFIGDSIRYLADGFHRER